MKLLPIANSNPAASGGPIASVPASTAVPQSLRTTISWSFLGLAAYAASQWGMLVVLARLTSPAVVGQFTISLALTGPILLLAGLDLRIVQAADASRRFAFSDYFGLRLIVALLAFAVVTVLSLALGYESTVATVIVAMGLAKSLELQSDAFHGLFQQRERMDLFARSLLVRGGISLTLFAAAIHLTQSVTVGVAALAASTLIVLFWCDVPNAAEFLPGGCRGLLSSPVAPRRVVWLFVVALPAGLRAFLRSLEISLPYLFLQQYHGNSAVGTFAARTYSRTEGKASLRRMRPGDSCLPAGGISCVCND